MDFTTLGALLRLYEHNMKVLHWGCYGPKFDRGHKLCDDYAAMIHDDVDWAGETGLRLDQNPPSFDQILDLLKDDADHNYIVCQYKLIDYPELTKTVEKMLVDIIDACVEIHDSELLNEPKNVGIKSAIEAIIDKYDFEARYLNRRRMMPREKGEGGHGGGHGHHED